MKLGRIGAALAAGAVLWGLASIGVAGAQEPPTTQVVINQQETGIRVDGTGRVSVTPDRGRAVLGIEATAPTVQAARAQAADAMQDVIDALRAAGVASADIQTTFFNISPQREPFFPTPDLPVPTNAGRITGFTVTNLVTVTVRNLNAFGPTIDAAITAGGDLIRVQDIGYEVSNTTAAASRAMILAIQDARNTAREAALAAGVTLGSVRSMNVSRGGVFPAPIPAADAGGGGGTPLSPGQLEVSVYVNIVYEIVS